MFVQLLILVLSLILANNSLPTGPCSHSGLNDEPGINLQLSYNKLGYVTNMSLGTPPQAFQFDVSTRTQEFWVRSSNCSEFCERNPKYNASLSTSHKKDGRPVTATFSNIIGELHGYLSSETVTIGEGTVEDVSFGEITNVFGSFYDDTDIAGTLGLGFKPNPPFDFFVDDLLQFTCIHKVGGFYLKRIKLNKEIPYVKDAGHVTLGSQFGDRSLYDGKIHWVKGIETSDGDQLVPVQGITAGNISLCREKCEAQIDTTMMLMALPGSSSFDLNEGLGFIPWIGSGYFTLCNRRNSLPNVTFNIEGFKVSIAPQEYLIEMSDNPDAPEEEKICMSMFYANEEGTFVLGRSFLYNAYTLFDYDQKKFGFASFKPESMIFAN